MRNKMYFIWQSEPRYYDILSWHHGLIWSENNVDNIMVCRTTRGPVELVLVLVPGLTPKSILKRGLLQGLGHPDVFRSLLVHLLHAQPQPLSGPQVRSVTNESTATFDVWWRRERVLTSYSLTTAGVCSFSPSFCCLFTRVSMQWWQQRIFSSSFSSSMDVTLLRLLMLPRLEPMLLLLTPPGRDWEWLGGLPWTHRASLVPLISFSVK